MCRTSYDTFLFYITFTITAKCPTPLTRRDATRRHDATPTIYHKHLFINNFFLNLVKIITHMKTEDYLHSELLGNKKNNNVFQHTYTLIQKIATKITEMEIAAFNVTDKDSIETLQKINAIWISDEIIELVNYTIDNFDKRRTS